jgi:hypothetical protein
MHPVVDDGAFQLDRAADSEGEGDLLISVAKPGDRPRDLRLVVADDGVEEADVKLADQAPGQRVDLGAELFDRAEEGLGLVQDGPAGSGETRCAPARRGETRGAVPGS